MKIPRIPITDELRADIERQMAELRLTWDKLAALVPASKPGLWQAFSLAAQRSTAKKGRDNSRYTIRVCQILNLNPVRYLLPPDERRLLRALDKARLHDQAETFIGEAEQRVAWLAGRPENHRADHRRDPSNTPSLTESGERSPRGLVATVLGRTLH